MHQLWRISKTAGALLPSKTHQLYNTVAMPAFTYTCDIWYTPPFKLAHFRNTHGSVCTTKLLQSIQGQVARYITGGLQGMAYNILEVHANILPINLLLRKVQLNAATQISALPHSHPLYPIACHVARWFINQHRTPLHYLFHLTQVNPKLTKTISPTHKHPTYSPSLTTKISASKDIVFKHAQKAHHALCFKVYCDGSRLHKGVGAVAILYKNNRIVKISRFHLGAANKHTVYKAELVGVLLALNILTSLACQLINTVLIGLDNQAVIWALNDQTSKSSHYLLNLIHTACEKLQEKQDKLQNATDFHITKWQGTHLVTRTRGVFDLHVQWVLGHKDIKPNEKADLHAKRAA